MVEVLQCFVPHLEPSSKNMHSFLLLITAFLSIYSLLILCADDERYTNCKEAIHCGGITNISYPFWGLNRNNYCGQPALEIQCKNNITLMNMMSISYRVLEFNSIARTVKVARGDYWGTICPPAFVNTTLNFSLFDYTSGLTNMTFYYGCNINNNSRSRNCNPCLDTLQITSQICNINKSVISASYITKSIPSDELSTGDCETAVTVPIFTKAAAALQSSQTSIEEAVDEGFNLRLQIDENGANCLICEGSGGACGYNNSNGGFLCLCQDKPYPTMCSTTNISSPSGSGGLKKEIAIGLAVGAVLVFIVASILCISRKRILLLLMKCKRDDEFDVEAFIRNYGSPTPKRYSYSNVKKITNSFKDQIGKGGYGTVYKGTLPDGLLVAVKVLSDAKGNGEDFINEVASIGRTSHVNIVTLCGFCYEKHKRALIYEYMPNGSLDNFTKKHQSDDMANSRLEWKTLSEIAVGIAKGLEYLHRGCNTRILHFDIKPQNILLDKDFCPKITDFGLSKLCKTKESTVSMLGTRGTVGYIAPEVFSRNFGGVSHKSDVYSYGMLVLEMVGARKNLDLSISHTSEMFPHYVYKYLELDEDENMFGAVTEEEKIIARKMVLVSLWCIQTIPSDRPSMSKVIEMLEGPLHSLKIAPKPFLCSPTTAAAQNCTTSQPSENRLTG